MHKKAKENCVYWSKCLFGNIFKNIVDFCRAGVYINQGC